MLELNSSRWSQLRHAYGEASDVPGWLRAISEDPSSSGNSGPWFSLWSALAHQGDVFSSSYAAVPHVVAALARAPERADPNYFQFPAWVEICRIKSGPEIPLDLQSAYFDALGRLPSIIAAAAVRQWDPGLTACCLAALAASKGQVAIAEAALEWTPEVALEFLRWRSEH